MLVLLCFFAKIVLILVGGRGVEILDIIAVGYGVFDNLEIRWAFGDRVAVNAVGVIIIASARH